MTASMESQVKADYENRKVCEVLQNMGTMTTVLDAVV